MGASSKRDELMSETKATDLHIESTDPTEGRASVPVLLIQGVGVAGSAWKPQVDELSGEFWLASYDNRGVGKSPGPPGTIRQMGLDALEVMDQLGWEAAHLVGHSLGGVIAQQAAVLAPERARSLSLLCSFAVGSAVLRPSFSSLWQNIKTLVGTGAMRRRAFFEMVSDPSVRPTEEAMAELEDVFGRPLHELPAGTMAQVWALFRADLREELATLRVPTFVLSAEQDTVAPSSQGKMLAGVLRGRYVEVKGGHACTIQQSGEINKLLRGFWRAPEDFVCRSSGPQE